MRRILFVSHSCYLDDSSGAAVAVRALMWALTRRGWPVEVLCGMVLDLRDEVEPAAWLAERGETVEEHGGQSWMLDARGAREEAPAHFRLTVHGVPITVHRGPSTRHHAPDEAECRAFLQLYESALDRFRPDVVLGYGGNRLQRAVFERARNRGAATVFDLHNFQYSTPEAFQHIAAVRVPSRFAAEHYRTTLGLDCTVIPNIIDPERVRVACHEPKYLTFVNPSPEKGVFAFARIADELGRRRPDIPILVVEARDDERGLASCGLDLRDHGNVFLMAHTSDPKRFYRVSRLVLMPSLWRESQGLVAAEAMVNGIPVIGSERGALPETLGDAGIVLPLPDWLTPTTRLLPTAEEVAPWVEAILRLWDDRDRYEEHRRRALAEATRWAPEVLEPEYERFLERARPGSAVLSGSSRPDGRCGPDGVFMSLYS